MESVGHAAVGVVFRLGRVPLWLCSKWRTIILLLLFLQYQVCIGPFAPQESFHSTRTNLPQEPGASSELVLLPVLSLFDWRVL